MNDGFAGLPAYHASISERDLARRTKKLGRKAVHNALKRLEKRGHLTLRKGPSDGTRKGPNARLLYRIDLIADKTTAFHDQEPSPEPSGGQTTPEKGPSYKQREVFRESTESPDFKKNAHPELLLDDAINDNPRHQAGPGDSPTFKDHAAEIAEARRRYSPQQLDVIDAALADIARTRKSGRVADSVVAAEYRYWAGVPPEQVVVGLQAYVGKRYALDGKNEKYARGIIRRVPVAGPEADAGSTGRRESPEDHASFRDGWKRKFGEPPETIDTAVEMVRNANPDEWAAGLVLESYLNFLDETDPQYVGPKTPLTWAAKWRAYTNNGDYYQRRVPDDLMGVFG